MHGKKEHQADAQQDGYLPEQDVDSPELHTKFKND